MSRRGKMKKKTTTKYLFVHIVLIAGTLLTVFPFLWMIFTSFKGIGETMRIPPTILPESLKLDGYKGVLEALPFARVYLNTIIVTVITVLGQILFCSMAAFAFARLRFRGKNLIFIIILSVLMVPSQIFIMPQYLIMQKLGVLDSLPALFIQNLCSAFTVFLSSVLYVTSKRAGRGDNRGWMWILPDLCADHASADQTWYCCSCDLYRKIGMEQFYVADDRQYITG